MEQERGKEMFCVKCGKELEDGTKVCPECGTVLDSYASGDSTGDSYNYTYSDQGQNGSQYSYNGGQEPYQQPAKGNGNGFAIAGFVLSLVSILACCLYYVAIPCAVLAIIFSVLGRKSAYRGLAIAGIVIGIVGLAITLMLLAFAASLVNSGDYYEYMKWLEEYME